MFPIRHDNLRSTCCNGEVESGCMVIEGKEFTCLSCNRYCAVSEHFTPTMPQKDQRTYDFVRNILDQSETR